MRRTILAFCVISTAVATAVCAQDRLPGQGQPEAGNSRNEMLNNSPSAVGSNVGANPGAGITGSPLTTDVLPRGSLSPSDEAPRGKGLFGLSREIPVR